MSGMAGVQYFIYTKQVAGSNLLSPSLDPS